MTARILAMLACVRAGDRTAIGPLGDALEEAGDPRAGAVREIAARAKSDFWLTTYFRCQEVHSLLADDCKGCIARPLVGSGPPHLPGCAGRGWVFRPAEGARVEDNIR